MDASAVEVANILEQLLEIVYDASSGEVLDGELTKIPRNVEMETFKKHGLYQKVPLEECWRVTGKSPTGVKWVDENKGEAKQPEYRSRLVAKEIKHDEREDLFAATPPLEAKKSLFSLFASMPEMRLDFIDVVRVYFHARARREMHVELPRGDHEE